MRKVVTGILALCMVSAMMAESVIAAPDTVKGDVNGDGVINTRDIVTMQKYLLGEDTDIDTDGADLNNDKKINVADMIYLTGIFTEAGQIPKEDPKEPEDPAESKAGPEAIAEMNKTARNIFYTAVKAEYYLDILHPERKLTRDLNIYNNEDGSEITELMKQDLELPDGTRWSVVVSGFAVKGCICTSNGVTGAYPNEIPMSVNADYDKITEAKAEYYSEVNVDWKEAYPEWVSSDKNIKDYVPETTAELNSTAEILFDVITAMQQEAETAGKSKIAPLDYTGTVADGNIEKQCRDKIFGLTNLIPQNTAFALSVRNGEIVGCICTDSYGKMTGAYPNTVPQTMNIPYTADNAGPSGNIGFDWKQAFPQYISDDPVQSALPDYPEKTVDQYNDFAKKVFTGAQTIIQDKDAAGETVPSGVYTEENELFADLGLSKGKYIILVKDGVVIYCLTSGGELTRSGAYPGGVPLNMDIPFDELVKKMPHDADDFKPDWKRMFPDHVSEKPEHQVKPVSFYNNAAKSVFTEVQTMIMEYETAGKNVPNGIYTSESELFREFADDEYEFTVKIENNTVLGAAAGCKDRSGAYPVNVPQLLNVPFDKNLADISYNPNTDWNALYPDGAIDFKTFSSEIGNDFVYIPDVLYQVRKASVNSANTAAKNVFTTAMVAAMECEDRGEVIDGVFSSSDEASEFVQMIKRDISPTTGDWAVKVKNNEVVGACTSTSYGCTGAYPNFVPAEYLVDYKGYNDLCEKPHKSTEWLSVGYEFAP